MLRLPQLPRWGEITKEQRRRVLHYAKRTSRLLYGVIVLEVAIAVFVALCYYWLFHSQHGLPQTFESLNKEMLLVEKTVKQVNVTFQYLSGVMHAGVHSAVYNLYELCYQFSLHDDKHDEPRGKCQLPID
eukprot:m.238940 g.238940  ORF g.238940 m.238940 type:complete len:130 (+) comp18972_c1_seq12:281-670(+)